jgi:hypothetical protein
MIDCGSADSRPVPRLKMSRRERWSAMSQPRGKYLAVALAVLALLGAAHPAQAQVTLRYQFKEGEKLRYLVTMTMKMKVDAKGENVEANVTMKMPVSLQTIKVHKNGKAEILTKLEGMKMTIEAGEGKSFSVDTDNLESLPEQVRDLIQKMLKDGITMTQDPLGQTSDVKMPDSWKALLQKGGNSPLNMGMMGNAVFPKEPVTKGQTWKSEPFDMEIPQAGKLKGEISFTYDGTVTRGVRQLEKITMRPKMSLQSDPNTKGKLALKVRDTAGTLYFDNRAGHIAEMQMDMGMDLDVDADGMQGKVRMEMKGAMKLQKGSK